MRPPSEGPAEPRADGPGGVRTTKHRGRMTDAKWAVLRDLGPRWMLDPAGPWDHGGVAVAFGRAAPVRLDIGVGDGRATVAWALGAPDADVVAVELHRPGVSRLLGELEAGGPTNVRVAMVDALVVLEALPIGCVEAIRVLFPDPWPKRRHVGRRLVDPAFARRAAEVLAPGGLLHLATDWDDYADHMRAALATEDRLLPVVDHGTVGDRWSTERPARPVTAYERRGLRAGRTITDLVVTRIDQGSS